MTKNGEIPTLIAERVDGYDDQWKVWCKYCKEFHYHGAVEGHRLAHCRYRGSSPYLRTGYIIAAPTPKASPTSMKAV
jgi:hypothetical protein